MKINSVLFWYRCSVLTLAFEIDGFFSLQTGQTAHMRTKLVSGHSKGCLLPQGWGSRNGIDLSHCWAGLLIGSADSPGQSK